MLNTQHSEFKSVKNADLAPGSPHNYMYSSRRIFLAVCLSHCRPGRNEQYMYTVLLYIK